MTDLAGRLVDASEIEEACAYLRNGYAFDRGIADLVENLARERDEARTEIDHIKQVEFPKRVKSVCEVWRTRAETAEAEVARLTALIAGMEKSYRERYPSVSLRDGWDDADSILTMLEKAVAAGDPYRELMLRVKDLREALQAAGET